MSLIVPHVTTVGSEYSAEQQIYFSYAHRRELSSPRDSGPAAGSAILVNKMLDAVAAALKSICILDLSRL